MLGFVVTETIENARPDGMDYPLLNGDLILKQDDGTWFKVCPGTAIGKFVLTEQQVTRLKQVEYTQRGLDYTY